MNTKLDWNITKYGQNIIILHYCGKYFEPYAFGGMV